MLIKNFSIDNIIHRESLLVIVEVDAVIALMIVVVVVVLIRGRNATSKVARRIPKNRSTSIELKIHSNEHEQRELHDFLSYTNK